jgi:hypothetical protein
MVPLDSYRGGEHDGALGLIETATGDELRPPFLSPVLSPSSLRVCAVSATRAGGSPGRAAHWLGRASKPGRPSNSSELGFSFIFFSYLSQILVDDYKM